MAAEITFDFISRGGPALARDFKSAGDNAAAAARGAKVLSATIEQLGKKENRTAQESVLLAKALRLTGDAEDRAAAKALAADIAIRRLGDAMQDTSKSTDSARGGFAGLVGEVTGFGAASTAASSKSSMFARALAGINLASGVLEPALAGAVVAAGGLAAAFAAAGAGAAAYGVALKPLLSQTTDVMKAQETLDKARATAQAGYDAAIKSGASAKTADAARTKAMTAAQDKYNIAVKGTPGPVREFAKSVTAAQDTYKSWADSLARPVLAPLSGMLKLVKPALTAITPLVRVAAGAFGTLVTELSAKVSAGGLTSIVSTLLPHVRTTILDLGHAAGNVAAGIWGILKAFLPVSGQITGGVVKLTARFKEWGQSLSGGTGFQSLMTTFREETPQAIAILTNLGVVLGNVGKAMFGLSSFSNSKMLLNMLLPLSQVMASLSANTDLVRVALYGLLAVKIGQQFSWVTDAWKGIVKFAAATEGATAAEVIAAAATRAWALATAALPWVALAAAVVAVAVLIIKYHSQIWAFVQRVWHDILAVIMGTWNWVKTNWPLLLAILTGPIGLAVLFITRHWKTMTTGIAAMMDIAKESIRITWDKIKLLFLQGVDFIMRTMGKLPGPLGAPFRAAHASIKVSMDQIQRDVGAATRNIQADFDRLHGKTLKITMEGNGYVKITEGKSTYQISQGAWFSPHAEGGFISGGTPGRDSVPGMLMPGEVVVPTRLVQAGAVDHLRGRLPGFAGGGQVPRFASGGLAGPIDTWPHQMYAQVQDRSQADMGKAMRSAMTLALQAGVKAARTAMADPFAGITGVPSGGKISGSAQAAMNFAKSILWAYGWKMDQWPSLQALWMGESGWNYRAYNASSGATGIPQSLPGSKMASAGADWRTNPATQIRWGLGYIKSVYGSPANAYSRWLGRSPHWYSEGGLVPGYAQGGLVPGYASGGTVARQGQTYLNAWRSRRGGHYALAVGPRPLNQQIPAMAAAYGRARTLAGAGGLSPGQHRFWANTAAGEGKLLATLRKELATERSWRYHLQLDTLALDREIRTAGNLPGLAGPVRGWKRQLAARRHTIGEITGMIGHPAAAKPKPKPPKPPGVPGSIPHTGAYTDRTADLIAQLFAASAALTRTVTLDSGGTLAPGWNAAYNGTGRPEQLIPASRGGGGGTIVLQNHGVIGSQAQLEDWLVRSLDNLRRKRRL